LSFFKAQTVGLYEGGLKSSQPSLLETWTSSRWVGNWTGAGVTTTLQV
jgi:hypothetical protein